MRKLFLFLCAALMSVGMFAATEVTITQNDFPSWGQSFTKDGVTVSAGYAIDGQDGNIMGGGSFSTTLGNFTKIEISAMGVFDLGGEGWSIAPGKATWTGNASSVSFTGDVMGGGQGTTLIFTIGGSEPEPEPEPAGDEITVTWNNPSGYGFEFTQDGVTLTCGEISSIDFYGPGTFTTDLGNFTKIEVYAEGGCYLSGDGWSGDINQKTWTGNAASVSFSDNIYALTSIVFTIEPAAAPEPEPEPEPAGTVVTITNADLPTETTTSMSKDGVTITVNDAITNTMIRSQFGPGTFTNTIGNFTKIEVVGDVMNEMYGEGWTGDASKRTWTGNAESVQFAGIIQGENITITCTLEPAATPEPEPEPESDSETLATNTGDASYAGTHFSVTPNAGQEGDSKGFFVTYTDHATISALNGETILSVELTVGDGEEYISYFGASKGNVSHSGSLITISEVNATSVELLMTYMSALQISQVKIYYAEAPAPAEDVNITPNVDPDHAGVYYSTFYDSANKYALPAGVEAYVATRDGANLLLSKIAVAGQTIPADNAVILKSSVASFTLSISDAEPVDFNAINHLQGSDESIATPDNCYVLAGNEGVGFYHYTASMLNAHKAYVIYSGSNQAPKRMPFIFDQATGVENVQGDKVQSTKVIENGVLYIIKNGVKFNAQGQVVK